MTFLINLTVLPLFRYYVILLINDKCLHFQLVKELLLPTCQSGIRISVKLTDLFKKEINQIVRK